jgi:hypothetical protein
MIKKWLPRRGQVFTSRDELETKLLDLGWEFEGCGTSLEGDRPSGYDIGVTDKKSNIWIIVEMVPLGVKVTKVKKIKLSDYSSKRG